MTKAIKVLFITLGVAAIVTTGVIVYKKKFSSEDKEEENLSPIAKQILTEARKYVGIEEITPNAGWKDSDFQDKMIKYGWQKPNAYCATFVRMVILLIAQGEAEVFFNKALSASAIQTWNNLSKKNNFCEKITKPEAGCIVCYEHHTEICESTDGTTNVVITANSLSKDANGNIIEGVFRRNRAAGKAIDTDPFKGYIRITNLG